MPEKQEKLDKFYGINLSLVLFEQRFLDIERVFIRKGEEGRFGKYLSKLSKEKKVYRLVPNDELSVIAETEHHEGVCLFAKAKKTLSLANFVNEYLKIFQNKPIIVLDQIQNPHNIGSIYRSAAYFGFSHILVISKSSIKLSGSLARVSEGGTEFVSTCFVRDSLPLIEIFKKNDISIISTDLNSSNSDIPYELLTNPYAIVIGSEQLGVSKDLILNSILTFRLEGTNKIQSLNAGVSSGIIFNTIYLALKS